MDTEPKHCRRSDSNFSAGDGQTVSEILSAAETSHGHAHSPRMGAVHRASSTYASATDLAGDNDEGEDEDQIKLSVAHDREEGFKHIAASPDFVKRCSSKGDANKILNVMTAEPLDGGRSPRMTSRQASSVAVDVALAASAAAVSDSRSARSPYIVTQDADKEALQKLREDTLLVMTSARSETDAEAREVCDMLDKAMQRRTKYAMEECERDDLVNVEGQVPYHAFNPRAQAPQSSEHIFESHEGVFKVWTSESKRKSRLRPDYDCISYAEYSRDLEAISVLSHNGPIKSFCFKRLQLLEARWNLHLQINEDIELAEQKSAPKRDFYNVRKVDAHIHHSAAMNQKHLLRFIKKKMKTSRHEQVLDRKGKILTLGEVFDELGLTFNNLSLDTLNVHAVSDNKVFQRFDKFNLKYNPAGQSHLREIFMKTDNFIQGRYLAELTQELIADLVEGKYQNVEWRVSIYGRNPDEWSKLADWIVNYNLYGENVRWFIQVPRLYSIYRKMGTVKNFQQFLDNIFQPLFENPSSNPKLHYMLKTMAGFDSVDDESKADLRLDQMVPPHEWDRPENPPYNYYAYYMWANLNTLNQFRAERGFNTFEYRPHCGEAGDIHHLDSAFLLCTHGISHGINLRKSPALQYLFYLTQIGLAMSPLSNNSLFLNYHRNPFPQFFARGLNVSLSTDDPLMFHFTKEPLMEEYSVAAQVWHFNSCDLCELARNSVLQSGFESAVKRYWLGKNGLLPGTDGNDIERTNVPPTRIRFRTRLLEEERWLVSGESSHHLSDALHNYNSALLQHSPRRSSKSAKTATITNRETKSDSLSGRPRRAGSFDLPESALTHLPHHDPNPAALYVAGLSNIELGIYGAALAGLLLGVGVAIGKNMK